VHAQNNQNLKEIDHEELIEIVNEYQLASEKSESRTNNRENIKISHTDCIVQSLEIL